MFKLAQRALSLSKKPAQFIKPDVQQATGAPKMLEVGLLKQIGGGTTTAVESPRNGW